MKRYVLSSCLLFAFALSVLAQQQPLTQTEDISGMYTFLKDGEFVQIDVEDSRVSGFVSRYGDRQSDSGAFLDHLIKEGSLKGNAIHFATKTVHGLWFEFTGTAERGEEKDPNKEGYRTLKGKLTQYSDDENSKTSAKTREVVLKSFPSSELVGKSK